MGSFYTHENFPLPVVTFYFHEMGNDVPTFREAGKANHRIPGDEVLNFATHQTEWGFSRAQPPRVY